MPNCLLRTDKDMLDLPCKLAIASSIFALSMSTNAQPSDSNARFKQLETQIFSQPYETLPNYKVTRKNFGKSNSKENNQLLKDAVRTLNDERDIIEFAANQKLLNANGICFSGIWRITENNPYTGLFKQGTQSPAIVRASVALSGTRQKNKRAFGVAVKLLPNNLGDAASLNVFALHSMGGTITKHVLDLIIDNQPPLGNLPKWSDLSTALRLRNDLQKADRLQGAKKPQVAFRPVNHLASYNTTEKANSPKWLRLTASTPQRVDKDDFRDELRVEYYPETSIHYRIEVAADTNSGKKTKAKWQTIGVLELNRSVTSAACDTKLHFKHPPLE